MSNTGNKRLIYMLLSAMFLALALVMPFLTGQVPQIGSMLLPMHIPIMLCGLICGWQYGLAVGVIAPLLRTAIFSMPVLYPMSIAMSFELATYGFVIGLLYNASQKQTLYTLYRSMICAMFSGRVVWGLSMLVLMSVGSDRFTISAFLGGSFLNAIPGIVLQLILIPAVMLLLHKTHLVRFKKGESTNGNSNE